MDETEIGLAVGIPVTRPVRGGGGGPMREREPYVCHIPVVAEDQL